jgi:uncharacterized protein YdaU (DUF1376 family)
VNYYEHHLGDYAAATAHLSWDEDMAYTRLLRAYYHHERGVADGEQYRLARAQSKPQRAAVDVVLREFFVLIDGIWRQKRADSEIGRFKDKQTKAKRSADARWSGKQPHSEGNANASPDAMRTDMRTHSEGNAPSLQSPDTNHHKNKDIAPDGASLPAKPKTKKPVLLPLPTDFGISARVEAWAAEKGFTNLASHLEAFRETATARAYAYADWDAAFMKAIREDWAHLRTSRNGLPANVEQIRTRRELGA